MILHTNETDARILIDDQLRAAGWNPADKSQVLTEVKTPGAFHGVAEPESQSIVLATQDGDAIPTGRADYVLLDSRGRPLAIIEAKRQAIQPYVAKQQALPYAKQIGAPFIFLTNGELIYFWDYQNDDARIVQSFFSRRDLERLSTCAPPASHWPRSRSRISISAKAKPGSCVLTRPRPCRPLIAPSNSVNAAS